MTNNPSWLGWTFLAVVCTLIGLAFANGYDAPKALANFVRLHMG